MRNNTEITGLTSAEVAERHRTGNMKNAKKVTTKSYKQIFTENIFSLFNFINLIIACVLLYVGSAKNCLFMIVVVCNTIIGIIQEVRSKRTIDKLSIINQSTVNVIRDGRMSATDITEIVKDDVIELAAGAQVPNDCTVIDGSCEVNESLITGESDSIYKEKGSSILSGSFVISGRCYCRVDKVGSENYADSILGQIKYVKKTNSEIVRVIKRIILVISISIIPFSALLFYNQIGLSHNTFEDAVVNSAAAIIGMIPEGLVLLISTVFAIGVIRLSKKNVLSQDLYSLESLARTDVLCLDKTGTVTTGEMTVHKAVPAKGITEEALTEAINVISYYCEDNGSTIAAIKEYFTDKPNCAAKGTVPFSSDRKWSAVCTEESGTYIMGAAEMIFGDSCDFSVLSEKEKNQFRIVAFAHSECEITSRELPDKIELLGFILLSERLRDSISETLNYFREQDVDIKIISGDNPITVQKLCSNIMPGNGCSCVDMSKVDDEDIPSIAENNQIFGRVTPKQKKMIISSLRKNGHTVGMVGDGVNDVLALKESDCSIGLANGSEAARNVSQLVLMDSDFSSLPEVVKEGRRSINNLQNSSAIFLAKTIFSAVMTLIFMFLDFSYPFEPIQMTLISALTIGMPSFILSFEKNNKRVKGRFLLNVVSRSIPAALTNIIGVMVIVLFGNYRNFTEEQISSLCVLTMAVVGLLLIIHIYKPVTNLRKAVLIFSIGGFVLSFMIFNSFFGLAPVYSRIAPYMLGTVLGCIIVFEFLIRIFEKAAENSLKKHRTIKH